MNLKNNLQPDKRTKFQSLIRTLSVKLKFVLCGFSKFLSKLKVPNHKRIVFEIDTSKSTNIAKIYDQLFRQRK